MITSSDSRRADRLFATAEGREILRLSTDAIRANGMEDMLRRGTVVGFSGGADSVMLLLVLEKLRETVGDFPLAVLHVHHGLRGAEADADEAFSRAFAAEEGVPFFSRHVDVRRLAKESGESLETAARDARYSAFRDLISGRNEYGTVALAHNATDNLETVLFRILRGAGTHGGIGILPVRDEYVRPLLYVPKADIVKALEKAGIPFVTDSTNSDTEFSRNYIRHEILPKLSKICPSPEVSVRRFSQNLMTDDSYLCEKAEEFLFAYADGYCPVAAFSALHPAIRARVLTRLNQAAGGEATERVHVEAVETCLATGHPFRLDLPGKTAFVFDGDGCFVTGKDAEGLPEIPLSFGENDLSPYGFFAFLSFARVQNVSFSNVYKFYTQADLGSAIIHGELRVRERRDGDAYFYGGRVHKLKKLLASAKISARLRNRVPIVVDDRGILYVPGFGVRDDGGHSHGPHLTFASVSEDGDLFLSRRQKSKDRPSTER